MLHRLLLAFALLLAAAPSLSAQSVSGTITHATRGTPVVGAIVFAVTDRGDTTAHVLTRTGGRYLLPLREGLLYTLVVRQIGMTPSTARFTAPLAGRDTTISLAMQPVPQRMPTTVVRSEATCTSQSTGTDGVAQLWADVVVSLQNSRAASEVGAGTFRYRIFGHRIDTPTGSRSSGVYDTVETNRSWPFEAAAASDLVARGFVVPDAAGNAIQMRAPDEAILLHDGFVGRHCFWTSRGAGDRRGMIGLHFVPVDGLEINEIGGTFWLEEQTSELRFLQFRYYRINEPALFTILESNILAGDLPEPQQKTGSNGEFLSDRPFREGERSFRRLQAGGELRFVRLDDGRIAVDRWRLWTPEPWERRPANANWNPLTNTIRLRGGDVLSRR